MPKKEIRILAVVNASKHNGKASIGSVIGMLIARHPDAKDKLKDLSKDIKNAVDEINKLSSEELEFELKEVPKEYKEEKKVDRNELKDLPNAVMGKVVTRLAPEPSKYNHIGHALSFLLNYMYAKKYKGRCILRFEDANPEKVTQEYVDAMKEDVLGYLNIVPDEVVFVSDNMELFYNYAEELIKKKKAYVCFCEQEKMQDLRHKGIECECSEKDENENLTEWRHMLNGKYKEGDCSLRLKGDMASLNHVMRDPVIFRIITAEHYMKGYQYKVWPMYDFYNSVEDSKLGVTHILRSNEFMMRGELQNYIKDLLNLSKQTVVEYGRFNVTGAITKGREIREKIESGEYTGWDDPRLVTLRALKRRGIVKETYYELVKQVGLSPTQTNIDFEIIAAINRKLIDKTSSRYFFLEKLHKIKIKNAINKIVKIPLHPEDKDRGYRTLETTDEFYIDEELEKDKPYRLMHLFNFKDEKFISEEVDKHMDAKMIHWLPVSKNLVQVEILMPDATVKKGLAEPDAENIEIGEVVQFERFGFCRLDKKEKNKLCFWFTHK